MEGPPREASKGCTAQGAGARVGGGRAAQHPETAPRAWRRGEWAPANLTRDARRSTSLLPSEMQPRRQMRELGMHKSAIVALKIQGRISYVSRRGNVSFLGEGRLETNEDKFALERLHTGH